MTIKEWIEYLQLYASQSKHGYLTDVELAPGNIFILSSKEQKKLQEEDNG